MKRLCGLWPALLCLAAFAFSAALWAGASLGTADARRQLSALLPGEPLSVYSRNEKGAPELTAEAVRKWDGLAGVKCALAVSEVPVTLSGYGFSEDAVAFGVPEKSLAAAGFTTASGSLPGSAWRPEMLLGSAEAKELAKAAQAAGQGMPGHLKLAAAGQDSGLDVFVSGVAEFTGTDSDGAVWMDSAALQALVDKGKDSSAKANGPLPIARADIWGNDVDKLNDLAGKLEEQGFLAVNPMEKSALTIREGREMTRQWGLLAALAGVASALAAWRCIRRVSLFGALAPAAACLIGMIAAAALMQAAMLLGWHFILSGEARYLLDLPRVLAIFGASAAVWSLGACLLPKRSPGV